MFLFFTALLVRKAFDQKGFLSAVSFYAGLVSGARHKPGNIENYYTVASILLVKIVLCSKLHCPIFIQICFQKGFLSAVSFYAGLVSGRTTRGS